jgi:16S rRNA (cytosine1402-N4)-methyltransferase
VHEHIPVLLEEVVGLLEPRPGGVYVDGTLGLGGHSERLLERAGAGARIVGIEWDDDAAARAEERLRRHGDAVTVVRDSYARLPMILEKLGIQAVDGILLDLGASSLQLNDPSRGFSFTHDGPLDMRMSSHVGRTAAELLESLGEKELETLFRQYGEERKARAIARAVCRVRGDRSRGEVLRSTRALAEFISGLVGRQGRIHPATRVFQALRIAVNSELENVKRIVQTADKVLRAPGGRIVVISFHSLEDRIVKHTFREKARAGLLRLLTKKPVRPGREETRANPRARSAKLRAAERT